jgi:hypothetical protein
LSAFLQILYPLWLRRPDRSELIFAAKRRSQDKPLILMAASARGFVALRAGESSRLNIVAASGRILLAGGINFGAAGFGKNPGGDEFDRPEYNRATSA